MSDQKFKTVTIEGVDIFYREAGDKNKPTILLLHGFPSSSHMYRDLINDLSADYHLIAPDYPGFGQSSSPSPATYHYSFDNLASTINHFIDAIGTKKVQFVCTRLWWSCGFSHRHTTARIDPGTDRAKRKCI